MLGAGEKGAVCGLGPRGKRTRARLLGSAAEVFAEKGYHEAKVSDVVSAAGLTQPAFYSYFPSKEAVFLELVAGFRARLAEITGGLRLPSGLGPEEVRGAVRSNVEGLYRFLAADPDLTRLGLFLAPDAEEFLGELAATVARGLRFEQEEGGYYREGFSPRVTAEILVGVAQRLTARYLLTGEKGPEELAARTAGVVLDGILARPAEGAAGRAAGGTAGPGGGGGS